MNCNEYVDLYVDLCKHVRKECTEPDEKHEVNMVLAQMKLQNCLTLDNVVHVNCSERLKEVVRKGLGLK